MEVDTVLRKEVVPGTYGRIKVDVCQQTGLILYGFTSCNHQHMTTLTADEIETAIETLHSLYNLALENESDFKGLL